MTANTHEGPLETIELGDTGAIIAPLAQPQEDLIPPSGGNSPSAGAVQPPDVKHPAKFSVEILAELNRLLDAFKVKGKILDPFGGVGGIHSLQTEDRATWAIEIEPEWAAASAFHGPTVCADFFDMAFTERYAAVVTSPTYGNRMADNHEAKDDSKRITYRHVLGRPLTEGNSGGLQWGEDYRNFHTAAWARVFTECLEPGGILLLNIKDHIRDGHKQPVAMWHKGICKMVGFDFIADVSVGVRGMGFGANGKARVENEHVLVLRKPS